MADYFTSDHFELLNKWKGQKRDESNPEQNRAYEELKKAYEVTEAWANRVNAQLFPGGRVDIRKRPTNQGNKFASYNWAKIYPSAEAPKELAYTVGIGADETFVVKIDTVGLDDADATRKKYLALRGPNDAVSPIVAKLPAAEGLGKTLDQLVIWSVEAIRNFKMRYDEVVTILDLGESLSDEDLLKHFDGKSAFRTFRTAWSPQEKALFCRLARVVHSAGLDWWHVDVGNQVRFGRKSPGKTNATGVLGLVHGNKTHDIEWRKSESKSQWMREPLSEMLVAKLADYLSEQGKAFDNWLASETERPGLWPDQLQNDSVEPGTGGKEELASGSDDVKEPINRIYYGPPGTGKTYTIQKIMNERYVTHDAGLDHARWIAERLAKLSWFEVIALVMLDFNRPTKVAEVVSHSYYQVKAAVNQRTANLTQNAWYYLQRHTIIDSRTVNQSRRAEPAVFDKRSNSEWVIVETEREQLAELASLHTELKNGPQVAESVKRYEFVTFHQSYGYEEFVEGLRPLLDGEAASGDIQYEIRPGVFKEICRRARLQPDQRFAIVIDEINRGNISKIFGELITLVEADKREGAAYPAEVRLPYSGELFSVPANLDIIGTMNTADRSLALLDTALRRRFDFVPLLPDARDEYGAPLAGLTVAVDGKTISIPRLLSALNQRIEVLYDREHCIGHAYFTCLSQQEDGAERMNMLTQVFRNRILPLLEEYFFEDWQKIRLVLADNQKVDNAQFVAEVASHEADLDRLFGTTHELNAFSTKKRYSIQESALLNPDAYIGIYQTLMS